MQNYRLREAIVAESRDGNGHMKLITLPTGSVLTLKENTREAGLVDATWQSHAVLVFVQDLRARADLTHDN
jgi:hypothetical protein